ncbi:MAG TPA: NapC/NirT family cytochrome c [Vicinamibacterales bacterium]|nr:NapC/NirT family cytochrome c [Vicinamibacterales bacterium]
MALTTATAVLFLVFFLADVLGLHANPYMGIVFLLVMPALFVLGLLLIPVGMWRERRRIRRGLPGRTGWPRLDLNDPVQRRAVMLVFVLTLANVVIISLAAYRGVHFMDSPQFCGEVCHEVMAPEYAAYQDGPHSRVSCVGCHIGPGAPYLVKSKIDGTRQVIAVMLNSHARPIPAPVHTLRPAREVCEQCHWPEKFHGDKVFVMREYASDEQNTESTTTLQIHVGGGSEKLGVATGIHWHMNIANEVDYIATDPARENIGYVRVKDRTGAVREYFADGVTEEQLTRGELRRMDCVDCHNRPAHRFAPSPERAVDAALASGAMPQSLPFVRREAVAALSQTYADRLTADREIATRLAAFYRSLPGDLMRTRAEEVERAVRATQAAYAKNVFPAMQVRWGTYPNHIGHVDTPGCFRCHDDSHRTRDGRTISMDCTLCHTEPDIK